MCTFIKEIFLYEYFTFEAALNRFCDRRELFDRLAKLFYCSDDADSLFSLVSCERVAEIKTEHDYKKFRRVKRYAEDVGVKLEYTEQECDAIDIKGRALTQMQELGFTEPGSVTEASVYANITQKAKFGVVLALHVLGVLQCEGLFFAKRTKSGIKNLSRAARWNHAESELALVEYDPANRAEHIQRLATLSDGLPIADISDEVCRRYGAKAPAEVRECILLSKAFGRGELKSQVYVPEIANLLYSGVVGYKDKEKLLLGVIKGLDAVLADIPLKLSGGRMAFDPSVLEKMPVARPDEQNRIVRSAANNDIRRFDSYRPLCISSGSRYMLESYADAITEMFAGANVARIDAGDISGHDLDPSITNIFIRSCNENADNVFLMIFCGEIYDTVVREACDFLQSGRRRRVRIVQPNIEIDLGDVLPVVFCDRQNEAAFRDICDVVKVKDPDGAEREAAILGLLRAKSALYGTGELTLSEGALKKLCAQPLDDAEEALDKAVVARRRGGEPLSLDVGDLSDFLKKSSSGRGFGYGGAINENR